MVWQKQEEKEMASANTRELAWSIRALVASTGAAHGSNYPTHGEIQDQNSIKADT